MSSTSKNTLLNMTKDDENFNPPSRFNRRNSILKMNDLSKTSMDDDEETTRFRKSRRVSFSSKLQIKEIENNHELKNDLITIKNTNANAAISSSIMNDISNSNNPKIKLNKQHVEVGSKYNNDSAKMQNFNTSDMELTDVDSFIRADSSTFDYSSNNTLNDEPLIVDNSQTINMGHETILFETNQTMLPKSGFNNISHETICEFNSNQTIMKHNKTNFSNQTMDIEMTVNETVCAFISNQTMMNRSSMQEIYDQTLVDANETELAFNANQTKSFDVTQHNDMTINQSLINKTKQNETAFAFNANQTKSFDVTQHNDLTINQSLINKTKQNEFNQTRLLEETTNTSLIASAKQLYTKTQSDSINHSKHFETTNQPDAEILFNESIKFLPVKDINKDLLSEMSSKKEFLQEQLASMINLLNERKQTNASRQKIIAEKSKEKEILIKINKELKSKLINIRKEINSLKTNADPMYLSFNKIRFEMTEKGLEDIKKENMSLMKEYQASITNLNQMKEKVQINFNNLTTLKTNFSIKQKLIDLGQDIFCDEYIDYKLINLEKDTIILSFFFDFIQLEIQATNIANDINSDQIDQLSFKDQKCLNYPIKKLFSRSTVDSASSLSIDTPFYTTDREKKFLKKKSTKNVPVFVRFCIDLILNEIGEGDLLKQHKKFKYIRDIPMLIAHLRLSCKCATNLARDFEHFATVSFDTKVKCDFDFKNHIVSITLPSFEDACFYKLKLNIIPGRYYQESIPFSIELLDPNDIYQPNIKRISKVVEGQYFENGSLRNYLRKLKLV